MWNKLNIFIACALLCVSCICCQKEDVSALAGTSWECIEEPEILVFNDNHSGIFYVKGATDGVYDKIYSSYDFIYETSGNSIKIHIFYAGFDSWYDFEKVDDSTLTCGVFHYRIIKHTSVR